MESAAILLSRTAMTARPVRLFTKFSTKNSVTRMSTTPEVKVEILVTPDTPIGPLMIILPPSPSSKFWLTRLKCRPASSRPRYITFTMFLMISPKARVTMAR